jgi:hypothetical protein
MDNPNAISLEEAAEEAFRILGEQQVIERIRSRRAETAAQGLKVVDAQDDSEHAEEG